MAESKPSAVRRLLTGWSARRRRRRQRWVEKQAAKKPGEMYTDYWKGGSR
jgi:hypothetical protein